MVYLPFVFFFISEKGNRPFSTPFAKKARQAKFRVRDRDRDRDRDRW